MKNRTGIIIVVSLLSLLEPINAAGQWGINPICGTEGSTFLQNEFNLVHTSAASMLNSLNTPTETTDTLVGYMFGIAEVGYDPISFPKAVFGGTESIAGLANIAGPISYDALGQNDTTVFCNMHHLFPPAEGSTKWYDSAFSMYRNDVHGFIQSCYSGENSASGLPPPNAMLMQKARTGAAQALIFCEWFMQRGMSAQFPNGRSFNSDFFRRAQAYKDRYGSGANTQIDLYYLFDSTFMHELTHSISGGSKADVDFPNSYRWANTRILSTRTDPVAGAQNNVDNYIMLKLANDMTSYGNNPKCRW